MTGKDLIMFILKYNLENVELGFDIPDGGEFITVEKAAVKLGISTTSLQDMIKLGLIDHIEIGESIYLHKDIDLSSIKRREV